MEIGGNDWGKLAATTTNNNNSQLTRILDPLTSILIINTRFHGIMTRRQDDPFSRHGRVRRRAAVPELLGGVGEPVGLRALEQHLVPVRDRGPRRAVSNGE